MKCNTIVILFLVMSTFLALSNQVQSNEVSMDGAEIEREMPKELYFARMQSQQNRGRELPSLEYWGVKDFEWGMNLSQVVESRSASGEVGTKELEIKKKSVHNYNATFVGVAGSSTMYFDGNGGDVGNGYKHDFAVGVKNRVARLAIYNKLKAKLIDRYNAPSHNIAPDEDVRGGDAYVQGVDHKYHLEWEGTETVVALRLSDEELVVVFKPSPNSRADEYRENTLQAEAFVQEVQARHEKLNNSSHKDN